MLNSKIMTNLLKLINSESILQVNNSYNQLKKNPQINIKSKSQTIIFYRISPPKSLCRLKWIY